MSWHTGRFAAFDTETTGVDVEKDRLVTAALLLVGGGQPTVPHTWLADPGIDIPEAASAVHGVTTERARAEGRPAPMVISEVAALLADQITARVPLVVMNARYDLTLLDRELQRHGLPSLAEQAGAEPLVLDPLVMDKRADRFRRGGRKLVDLARHYDVQLGDDAHDAGADALAAARIVYRIATRYPAVQEIDLPELHDMQAHWAREQAIGLQEYLRRKDPAAVVEPAWPLVPRPRAGA
ncbi:exonuclease domain-containing protein [Kitasatospora sp. NPDC127116]|uniref:exonuclease domain-containing protein n=1 Tax=Kitasatospora sp. NPDC127116 TaxID=3345367 RepID=UPI00362AB3A6